MAYPYFHAKYAHSHRQFNRADFPIPDDITVVMNMREHTFGNIPSVQFEVEFETALPFVKRDEFNDHFMLPLHETLEIIGIENIPIRGTLWENFIYEDENGVEFLSQTHLSTLLRQFLETHSLRQTSFSLDPETARFFISVSPQGGPHFEMGMGHSTYTVSERYTLVYSNPFGNFTAYETEYGTAIRLNISNFRLPLQPRTNFRAGFEVFKHEAPESPDAVLRINDRYVLEGTLFPSAWENWYLLEFEFYAAQAVSQLDLYISNPHNIARYGFGVHIHSIDW
jgi:hypothetical protein